MKPFLILFFIAASAFAQNRETRELTRDPASDVEAEYRIEDGSLSGVIHLPNGSSRGRVKVTFPTRDTILLKREETPAYLNEWEHVTPAFEEAEDELIHSHEKATSPGLDLPEPPDQCPCTGAECTGSINAWIISIDNDSGSQLTKSSVVGGWKRFVNNLLQCKFVGLPSYGGCVGAHPSTMGTNWYPHAIGGCTVTPAIVTSAPITTIPGHWEKSARGSYWNKDYGSQYTYTYTDTVIRPVVNTGAPTDLFHTQGFWGEGWERLGYYVDWTLISNCMQ